MLSHKKSIAAFHKRIIGKGFDRKPLTVCNRQQTAFYLFITAGDKPFRSKDFSNALGVSRVSFAPAELMEEMLGTKVGAATIFSAMLDSQNKVQIVLDKDVASSEWYGCSDGITTSYMKMLMYGKEASNRKQEIDRQYHTIPNQRPIDKHYAHYAQCRLRRNPSHSYLRNIAQ